MGTYGGFGGGASSDVVTVYGKDAQAVLANIIGQIKAQGTAGTAINFDAKVAGDNANAKQLNDQEGNSDALLFRYVLKGYEKITAQEQVTEYSCGYAALSMIFEYLGGAEYSQNTLEQFSGAGRPAQIPYLITEKEVYYDKEKKERYNLTSNGEPFREIFKNMAKGNPSIIVLDQGAMGFAYPAHAVIPVVVEMWREKNNKDIYYKT